MIGPEFDQLARVIGINPIRARSIVMTVALVGAVAVIALRSFAR
jgi:hypothetical protein